MIEAIIVGAIVGYIIGKVYRSPRWRYIIRWGQYVSEEEWNRA